MSFLSSPLDSGLEGIWRMGMHICSGLVSNMVSHVQTQWVAVWEQKGAQGGVGLSCSQQAWERVSYVRNFLL